jgi:hypothetical protein
MTMADQLTAMQDDNFNHSRSRSEGQPQLRLFQVGCDGALSEVALQAAEPEALDLRQFPYGAVLLPMTNREGNAVMVFKQPGVGGRQDVLIIEKATDLSVHAAAVEQCLDPRPGHEGEERLRVGMEPLKRDAGDQPASIALLQIGTRLGPVQWIDDQTRGQIAAIRYSMRAGDAAGWFEHGDEAFPDPAFRHGHPDIATREQGDAGIRGPSRPAMGIQDPIAPALLAPQRPRCLHPGERVIYELHVGTFTREGSLSAAADRLDHVKDMGFTTVQLMPIDISSGLPGWSYDQTRTGAVEYATYGGAEGLMRFVERAHRLGLEVIVDKQYNHEGPEQDSRAQIIPNMFGRRTKWGAGLSGRENPHYGQVIKLLGEEMAYWVHHFGIDGFRFDATNRLPPDIHQCLADFGRAIEEKVQKPLYLISEYAECEEPKARRGNRSDPPANPIALGT